MNILQRNGILLCSILLIALGQRTSADTASEARQQIEGLLAKRNAALAEKNNETVLSLYAPSAQIIGEEGDVWNVKQEAKRLKTFLSRKQSIEQQTIVSKFALSGPKALVVLKVHQTVVMDEPEIMKGQTLTNEDTLRQVWSNSTGEWRLLREQTIAHSSKMDGEANPFDMHTDLHQESKSPDGKHVATLAYRDSLTFGYYYVTIQPASGWHQAKNDTLSQEGLTKLTEVASEGLEAVKWKGPRTLIIFYNKEAFFAQKQKLWHDIRIVYRKIR